VELELNVRHELSEQRCALVVTSTRVVICPVLEPIHLGLEQAMKPPVQDPALMGPFQLNPRS
jgi:hypothetical protein